MKTRVRRAAQRFTLCAILVFAVSMQPAILVPAQNTKSREQSHFNSEQGDVGSVARPVSLPKGALDVLRRDQRVLHCARNQNISADQIPVKWFTASEIHLDGPVETDFVVLPRFDLDLKPSNVCLMGANIGPFWVLAEMPKGYKLLLATSTLGLIVLDSRTKGYRDIKSVSESDVVTTVIFKFDGQKYRVYRSSQKPIQ